MTIECARLGGINLSQGVCDTEVPLEVRRAAQAAIDEGCNPYTRYDGLPELRRAIAEQLGAAGLVYDAEGEIVVTAGATGAFYGACLALFDPGDDVMLFEPYYGYHVDTLTALGLGARSVTLAPPAWRFDRAALDRALTARTRAIVVNTPANPSGKVFTRPELDVVVQFACEHDLWIVTDEIYEHFVYDGRRHVAPASLPGARERTVTIGGSSKTFAVTGWRIGWAAAPRALGERLGLVNDLVYICAPAPLQRGCAVGLAALGSSFYERLRADYTGKRDRICAALRRAGIEPFVPEGAYYVLADISRLPGASAKQRAMHLLETTGVACVPGDAFYSGTTGATLARFCFAKTDADLDEACRRLERGLA
jgi:aminotransferase